MTPPDPPAGRGARPGPAGRGTSAGLTPPRPPSGGVPVLRLAALLALVVVLVTAGTALAQDGAGSRTDWSGAGTASDPYLIADAAQLRGLADSVNAGATYAGRSFRLTGDIDLGDAPWAPIGGACAFGEDGVPAPSSLIGRATARHDGDAARRPGTDTPPGPAGTRRAGPQAAPMT